MLRSPADLRRPSDSPCFPLSPCESRTESVLSRIILGLHDGPSGGAALSRDGQIIAVAEEDRLSRRAGMVGLPRAAIQTVLRETMIPGDHVNAVIVATRSRTYAEGAGQQTRPPLLYRVTEALPSPPSVNRLIRGSFANARRRRIDEAMRSEFGIACPVLFVDHHLAHAVGAMGSLGLTDGVAVTMDSGSDGVWAAVTTFSKGRPSRVVSERGDGSVLAFLDAVCDRLGIPGGLDRYRRLEDLGARGVTVHYDQLAPTFQWEEGHLVLDDGLFRSGGLLARVRASARKEDVAASALAVAAEHVRRWVAHWFVRTDQDALVLGGDLFGLPSMVRAVVEAAEIRRVRVSIAPDDTGLALAAAYAAHLPDFLPQPLPGPPRPVESPFLGLAFDDEEIEWALNQERMDYRFRPDIEADLARILAEGRSVVRFDGSTEVGDRALGNRVVLRDPNGPLRRGRLGFSLVPGAYHALVREDAFERYFQDDGPVQRDLTAQPALVTPRGDFARDHTDLVGWNGLIRVQIIPRKTMPRLAHLLDELESWTGAPLLAAAPFRLPNEPLVSSPRDAIRTFRLLGADFAALGRFLVRSEHESGTHLSPLATGSQADS